MRTLLTISLALLAGCPKPPPPPSVGEPVRLPAEESCPDAAARALPPLPARPAADPYQLARAELLIASTPQPRPITFLCDLPDRVLAIGATQTVQGGRRVVGGSIAQLARTSAPVADVPILPSSAGCRPDQPLCELATESAEFPRLSLLRDQWIHTGGWVSGREDMCRALPDDTIAVCSTRTRMAYVELGCAGQLQLGIHDTTLPRVFDLDVEVPNARLTGQVVPDAGAMRWAAAFTSGDGPVKAARLELDLDPGAERGRLIVDGAAEPCFVFGVYRR